MTCKDCKVEMVVKGRVPDLNPDNCSCCNHYLAIIYQCPKCKEIEVE